MDFLDIISILVEISLLLAALAGLASGNPDPLDYVYLFTLAIGAVFVGYVWAKEEIKIRKKMKEIREAREAKNRGENIT